MELIEEGAADVTIVAVAGRLDTQSAGRFGNRLGEIIHSGHAQLLIEASELSYISSAGFRALVIAARKATEHGGSLALCSMTPPIRRIVEISGLELVIDTYASREEALAKIAGG